MIITLALGVFLFMLSIYMFVPIFVYYVTNIGGNYMEFALIISLASLISSVIQPYIGYMGDKKGVKKILLFGCGLVASSVLFCAVGKSPWHLVILYIIFQIGLGTVVASLYSMVSRINLSENRSFIPYYRSIQAVGVVVGPIIGGGLLIYPLSLI